MLDSALRAAHDAVDHLILAAATLADATSFVRAHLGVEPRHSGGNPGAGTEHAVVGLGARRYLELVAPAPGEELAPSLAPLTALARPTLWGWAIATRDRARPDGSYVRWRNLAVQMALGAAAPFFIEWSPETSHPAETAPPAGHLRAFTVLHPDPDAVRAALAKVGIDVDVVHAAQPGITAELETLTGDVLALV